MSQRIEPTPTVRHLSIKNYKGIDEVDLALPLPRMAEDPDVMVIGSQNGLGKTSILECCSLLLSTLTTSGKHFPLLERRFWPVNLPDLLIRAGSDRLEINGQVSLSGKCYEISVNVNRRGFVRVSGPGLEAARQAFGTPRQKESFSEDLMSAISGLSADPVLADLFLLFHSYRKVQEGNPELGTMAEEGPYRGILVPRRADVEASRFKITILRSLMQRADLFEMSETDDAHVAIDRLNELLSYYAGGTISKVRPGRDNTVDFRIEKEDGKRSFTFDGLSSGQKEIVSTLFLVWYHTQKAPSVVLIDEPELHLNAHWHRGFVGKLLELAPRNQYVVATHSVDVMDSVDEDRRVLLSS